MKTGLIVCLSVAGALLATGIVTACLWLGVVTSMFEAKPPNAQCVMCGHRFNIPEHKGMAAYTREYPCPDCGMRNVPAMYYAEAKKIR